MKTLFIFMATAVACVAQFIIVSAVFAECLDISLDIVVSNTLWALTYLPMTLVAVMQLADKLWKGEMSNA